MNVHSPLQGLRVGCVQYLNSRPLIHGLPGVELAHPSELAARLRAGALDAALVPVFELLRSPEKYLVVDGVGIVSNGPVYSVFVAHQSPLESLKGVVADPASLTSIHLFKVLVAGVLKRSLPLLAGDGINLADPAFGHLWIGNQAVAHRLASVRGSGEAGIWDLGEQWTTWTGLPFVYAVWVIRRDVPGAVHVADAFRQLSEQGRRAIPAIAAQEAEFGRELAERYLTVNIRFQVGDAEKAGLLRFTQELQSLALLSPDATSLEFV
jgi:chorismate dehydratase